MLREWYLRTGLEKIFVDSSAYKDLTKNQDTGTLTNILGTLSNSQILSKLTGDDAIEDEDVYRVIAPFDTIKTHIMTI